MSDNEAVQPWRVLDSTITFQDRWLTVRSDRCLTPRGKVLEAYHVLEFPDWVNVVALTRDLKLILVREYRHGVGEVVGGLVSGTVDPEDDGQAETCARRELEEETGYRSGRFIEILATWPNSATQSNLATTYLALDAEPTGAIAFDESEAVEVRLDEFPAVLAGLRDGTVRMQALHVAALWSAAAVILAGGKVVAGTEPLRERLLAALGDR